MKISHYDLIHEAFSTHKKFSNIIRCSSAVNTVNAFKYESNFAVAVTVHGGFKIPVAPCTVVSYCHGKIFVVVLSL